MTSKDFAEDEDYNSIQNWDFTDLFDYCKDEELIDERDGVNDWRDHQDELIKKVQKHWKKNN